MPLSSIPGMKKNKKKPRVSWRGGASAFKPNDTVWKSLCVHRFSEEKTDRLLQVNIPWECPWLKVTANWSMRNNLNNLAQAQGLSKMGLSDFPNSSLTTVPLAADMTGIVNHLPLWIMMPFHGPLSIPHLSALSKDKGYRFVRLVTIPNSKETEHRVKLHLNNLGLNSSTIIGLQRVARCWEAAQ